MSYIISIICIVIGIIIGYLIGKLSTNKEKFELIQAQEQLKSKEETIKNLQNLEALVKNSLQI